MKRILITVAGFWLIPALVPAQPGTTGGVTITSAPPGAEVMLEGEARVSGLSPITFSYLLVGEYSLTVKKHGYEDYKTCLILDPARSQQVHVELSPKTGAKAALRSGLIPGWGQRYGERKTTGFLASVLFVGAGLTFLDAESTFQDREDDYSACLESYDAAVRRGTSIDELIRLHTALVDAQQEAYDAENNRRLTAGIVVGIWGLNVLDALLFTPNERATFSIKGIAIAPSADGQGVRLTLSKAF